jgi:oligosaccharide 4-alpha-D-glucosyltransferase
MRKCFFPLLLVFVTILSTAQTKPVVAETYQASNGRYVVSYYADNIIKLTFTPNGYRKNENVSDAVILKPKNVHPSLKVKVNGDIVAFNGKTILINADTMNGCHGFNFALETGEMIFGGGERALPLNRRGYRFNLYNNPWYGYSEGADNLNYSVPFFTSSKGYGLFFDNPSKGFVDIGKEDENIFKAGFSSGEVNVYVIIGKDYKDVLQSYHKLTGTQPLPPRWAFGNLMSRFGYTSEAQVKDILSKMESENIPVDAIIFDLFWFGDSIKGTLGNLDWVNKKKWPDPKKMIGDFRKKGINTILVTEPFFVQTSKNYQASKKYLAVDSSGKPFYLTDFYFGKGGLIDIFRKDSKDWFWGFYKKQMDLGVEAWWGDLGEPEKHPAGLYHSLKDLGHTRLFAADEVHNIYGHNWTKMLYEKYAKEYPNKRLFSLNRSGFAGSQRYSIFPWTGDVSRSWSGLRAQLKVLLGMSMSGVPYVHSDAGGFAGGEGDNELYVRWLQFAAFTPIFRPHGTALYDVEPAAKSFPSEAALVDTPWRDYATDAIQMRYGLFPYNYSLAYGQAKSGKPLMAPLYYHFPNDTIAGKIDDQLMWGDDILFVPILEKGVKLRRYYLPHGKWMQYEISSRMEGIRNGNQWYEDSVTIEDVIFFLREGCFVPMPVLFTGNMKQYSTGDPMWLLHLVSKEPSSRSLYFDDGFSKNALQTNNYKLISLTSKEINSMKYEIEAVVSGNYQKEQAVPFTLEVAGLEKEPADVLVNGKKVKVEWDINWQMLSIGLKLKSFSRITIIKSQ